MKNIAHENINTFAGACVDPPDIAVFWHYCSKGSLNVGSIGRAFFGVLVARIDVIDFFIIMR